MFIQVETIYGKQAINVNYITSVAELGNIVEITVTGLKSSITLTYNYDEFMEKLQPCLQPF